jgi:DNA-binding NarL/FixJ family response regulator
MSAGTQAAEEIAASEAIRSAASADAIQVLIAAGLVEEAAIHEAVEALNAAGLIIAAADEAVAESLAEAAATARAASITMAEERVLRYLPTKLTFAVIADKLGISRSAAKDRAERAYKKLGVHSRAEAVSRARELGLIG